MRDDVLGTTVGGGKAYKRKSQTWVWIIVLFMLVGITAFGAWHVGIKDMLKVTADKRAVERVELPITDPHSGRVRVTRNPAQDILWREFTLPSGLECVQLRQVNSSVFEYVCNYAKFNAEQETPDA